jgi:hypothetical protein
MSDRQMQRRVSQSQNTNKIPFVLSLSKPCRPTPPTLRSG